MNTVMKINLKVAFENSNNEDEFVYSYRVADGGRQEYISDDTLKFAYQVMLIITKEDWAYDA